MTALVFSNNVSATLDAGIIIGDTLLYLVSGQGALFATPSSGEYQVATLTNGSDFEIVHVTDNTSDVLTVVRGREGTTQRDWIIVGTRIFAGVTQGVMDRVTQNRASDANLDASLFLGPDTNDPAAVVGGFQASYDYAIGDIFFADNHFVYCTVSGTSDSSAPSFASDYSTVTSGGATFRTGNAYVETNGTSVGPKAAADLAGVAVGNRAIAPRASSSLGGLAYNEGVTAGVRAKAFGYRGVAIGVAAAYGDHTTAIGNVSASVDHSWAIHGSPMIVRDDWSVGASPYVYNTAAEAVGASWMLDLGSPPAWAASHVYTDADVVRPTTPNGKQYLLWCGTADRNVMTVTSKAAEPTWPTAADDSVEADDDENSYWICLDPSTGFTLSFPSGCRFYPTEVGFICQEYSGVTAAPFISVGDSASDTKFVNNQQMTGITGADMRHAFTGLPGYGVTELKIKLNTAATGTGAKFLGRFYWKGVFIEDKGKLQINTSSW